MADAQPHNGITRRAPGLILSAFTTRNYSNDIGEGHLEKLRFSGAASSASAPPITWRAPAPRSSTAGAAGPALEKSFANAGQVSPGYSTPWAAPGIPLKALKWMFQRHAPLRIRPDGSLRQWRWMACMLAQCSSANYAIEQAANDAPGRVQPRRAARPSRGKRAVVRAAQPRNAATVSQPGQLDAAARDVAVLGELGVPSNCSVAKSSREPSRRWDASRSDSAAGFACPTMKPETAICSRSSWRLRRGLGRQVPLRRRHRRDRDRDGRVVRRSIRAESAWPPTVASWRSAAIRPRCCAPWASTAGLSGERLSLTLPLLDEACAPVSTVLDETYKVANTRFDRRIRVGGMAELAGFDLSLRMERARHCRW